MKKCGTPWGTEALFDSLFPEKIDKKVMENQIRLFNLELKPTRFWDLFLERLSESKTLETESMYFFPARSSSVFIEYRCSLMNINGPRQAQMNKKN